MKTVIQVEWLLKAYPNSFVTSGKWYPDGSDPSFGLPVVVLKEWGATMCEPLEGGWAEPIA